MKKRLSMVQFAVAVKKSETMDELEKNTGLKRASIFQRLKVLRKNVPGKIKKFPRTTKINWDEVREAYENA